MIGAGPMKVDLKYLCRDTDRRGNQRIYYRKNGRKIRLREMPGSDAFLEEYRRAAAEAETRPPSPSGGLQPGSLRWLVIQYYKRSPELRGYVPSTQRVRRHILDGLCAKHGDKPYARLETRHVRAWRDARSNEPHGANNLLKALRGLFKWAVELGHMEHNPAKDVPYFRSNSSGFHTWMVDEVRQFEHVHPIGTKARLALAILLYTGVRRSDAVRLGRQHAKDGWHRFRDQKTGTLIEQPILPELQRVIDASRTGDLTYLVTAYGNPFTANGFGNRFREWCNAAGLPHCSAHGCRKAGATIAAENGATAHQLKAIFGWKTLQQAEHYTKAASKRRLAAEGMGLIDLERSGIKSVPLSDAVGPGGTFRGKK